MSGDPTTWGERYAATAVTRPEFRTVDVHSHLKVPASAKIAQPHLRPEDDPRAVFSSEETKRLNQAFHASVDDKFTDPEIRLADMDAMGIDVQMVALAPPQFFYALPRDAAVEVATLQNDRIGQVVADNPGKFAPVGTLPLRHPAAAVREAHRIHDLGFRAVEIGADVAGVDLDDPEFEPVWAALGNLEVVAVMHPAGFTDAARLTEYYLVNIIGIPLSSTLAVSRLILGGVFARHPGLRMLVMHGGGYLPLALARLDHAFRHRPELRHHIEAPPSEFRGQLFFDTTVFDPSTIESLVAHFGADHVLMGTDYPFDMGEGDPLALLGRTTLSDDEFELVAGGNATHLFGLGS
jgi:aminocarboxymuconate-semialdehyde decarboxylase